MAEGLGVADVAFFLNVNKPDFFLDTLLTNSRFITGNLVDEDKSSILWRSSIVVD